MEDLKSFLKKAHSFSLLTEEKEKEIGQLTRKGNLKAREELINTHLRMVTPIAKRFLRYNIMSLEDLIQEGILGLVTAADKFDPSKNVRFASYAKMWIVEFVKRKFYKECYIVKTPFRVIKKSFQGIKDLEASEKKKGENKAIINILKKPFYLDDSLKGGEYKNEQEYSLIDSLSDTRETAEEKMEKKDLRDFFNHKIVQYLNDKENAILFNRYLTPEYRMTYKKIGKKMNLSAETVRNIEKNSICKLRKKLENELSYI